MAPRGEGSPSRGRGDGGFRALDRDRAAAGTGAPLGADRPALLIQGERIRAVASVALRGHAFRTLTDAHPTTPASAGRSEKTTRPRGHGALLTIVRNSNTASHSGPTGCRFYRIHGGFAERSAT